MAGASVVACAGTRAAGRAGADLLPAGRGGRDMSNYAVVIVAWSGIDEAQPHRERIAHLERELRCGQPFRPTPFTVAWPCNDHEARGFACELVAVCHWNHFDPHGDEPDDLGPVLRRMRWEYPAEVTVMWKDENGETYEVLSGSDLLDIRPPGRGPERTLELLDSDAYQGP